MSSPEEQRFDFGTGPVEQAVDADQVKKRSPAKRQPQKRASVHRPGGDISSTTRPLPQDEETEALKARIERLKERATGASEVPIVRSELTETRGFDLEEATEITAGSESISIAEFYRRLKRAIASQFEGSVWVSGEIRSIKVSNGHHYIELADQGAEAKATQVLEIACWKTQWPSVEASLRMANVELEVGQVINVLGKVSVWEAAGKIRFNLSKIDVEALLGGIAAARAQLIRTLIAEGVFEKNHALGVSVVPLRIGLVTSQGSQAHQDFVGELARSGFNFEIEFAHSSVQGAEAPQQIVDAMDRLFGFHPDLIVLVRGGGSRNDLAAFDHEIVARAIATSSVPVWVGIGHTGDHSVADDVANMFFITPTACGEAIVSKVANYWDGVVGRVVHISGLARNRLLGAEQYVLHMQPRLRISLGNQLARYENERVARRTRVSSAATHLVRAQSGDLLQRRLRVQRSVENTKDRLTQSIRQRADLLRAFDPERQFARGWAMMRSTQGHVFRSVEELELGANVVVRLADGEAGVIVETLAPNPVKDHRKFTDKETP
jgi:exodeoxyribonuclease VII large subunit